MARQTLAANGYLPQVCLAKEPQDEEEGMMPLTGSSPPLATSCARLVWCPPRMGRSPGLPL